MSSILFVCLFVVFCSGDSLSYEYSSSIDSSKELLLATVLFRHGARTPINSYPNDPYINGTYPPYGVGQLTNEGKSYLFKNGQWLRLRYSELLKDIQLPEGVWAQSTDSDRTKMSLALTMAGLFPPKTTPLEWNNDLNWQPIPTHYRPTGEDALLIGRNVCPRYYEALEEVLELPEIRKTLDDNALLMDDLSRFTGVPIKTPHDVEYIQDTLNVQTEYGLKLPSWAEKFYPNVLDNLTELAFLTNIHTLELKQIRGGLFVERVATEFAAKRNNTLTPKNRKISLFAAHDYTMISVLETFGIRNGFAVPYGVMALFELLRDKQTNEIGVQAFLRNSATSGAIPLTIPGCANFCPIDQFLAITQKYIRYDRVDRLCKVKNPNFVPPTPSQPIFSL